MPRIISFYDTETTGLNDPAHRIIEANFRICDLDTRQELRNITYRFNPMRSIDKRAFEVHGIPLEDLKSEPTFEQGAEKISRIFELSDIMVAHNGEDFDFPFTVRELLRVGADIPDVEIFDTMKQGRWATTYGKYPALKELCFACGVEYDDAKAHAADYDTLVMAQCFWWGIDNGHFVMPTIPEVQAA